jgi:microcystin-dependent protein
MATPFLGQISMVAFNFAPNGWALCNGQLLPINQNQALFSLLGTYYGGDGQSTFALPNLQGSTPMHVGNGAINVVQGQIGGEAIHTLLQSEMPAHTHQVNGDPATATTATASGNVWAKNQASPYSSSSSTTMHPAAIGFAGGSQPHDNFQPYLVINFVIALAGIYPSSN